MFLVGALRWWYVVGWLSRVAVIKSRLVSVVDAFSFAVIARTFFAPFRQISAGPVGNSVADQFRGFLDKSFSRIIGAIVRFFVLMAGMIVALLTVVFGLIEMVLWPLVPLFPVAGVILFSLGVSL